jgi:hypothetical protein
MLADPSFKDPLSVILYHIRVYIIAYYRTIIWPVGRICNPWAGLALTCRAIAAACKAACLSRRWLDMPDLYGFGIAGFGPEPGIIISLKDRVKINKLKYEVSYYLYDDAEEYMFKICIDLAHSEVCICYTYCDLYESYDSDHSSRNPDMYSKYEIMNLVKRIIGHTKFYKILKR